VKHVKQNSWATADRQSQYKQKESIHRAKTFGKEIKEKINKPINFTWPENTTEGKTTFIQNQHHC